MSCARHLLLISCIVVLAGCSTTSTSKLQSDGRTWKVWIQDFGKCHGFSSADACQHAMKKVMGQRAAETCGREPARIFSCGKDSWKMGIAYACFVDCGDSRLPSPSGPVLRDADE